MKKALFLLVFLFAFCAKSYSQINFEKGYFINESDEKIESLIRNQDWKNNPTEFEYKLTQNGPVQKAGIKNIKEFGINDFSKYVKATVQLDQTNDEIRHLTSNRNPEFHEETLFLKTLIEGKASLYIYENGNLKRFFYKIDDSKISPLVHKRYYVNNNYIAHNNRFRQQLTNDLECRELTANMKKVDYQKRDLERFFENYNKCTTPDYVKQGSTEKRDPFNLSLRPGISATSFIMENNLKSTSAVYEADFGFQPSYRFGIEAEVFLPFNRNKWTVLFEPTFQSVKAETTVRGDFVAKLNYQTIQFPIGFRHYFFLNDSSRLFLNGSYMFHFDTNSSIDFFRKGVTTRTFAINSKINKNLAFGVGYKHTNRYSVELRYQTVHEILDNYFYYSSSYETLTLILGYSLF